LRTAGTTPLAGGGLRAEALGDPGRRLQPRGLRRTRPGDESARYTLNPGEAFAEDYRVLNERREGLSETPWQVVDQSFYPDQTTLDAVAADVTTPWTGPTTTALHSSFTSRATGRGFRVATPLDGTFRVTLASREAARSLCGWSIRPAATSSATQPAPTGLKSVEAKVVWPADAAGAGEARPRRGAFTLTVSKP
jgi:hypothetical protein